MRISAKTTSGLPWLRAALVEAVYPRRCAGCGRRGTWLCRECEAALPRFAPPWCGRCGVPVAVGACGCHDLPPSLTALRSAAPFAGWLRSAIVAFKYDEEWARAEHLGDLLASVIDGMDAVDALVPVPLHPHRQRRRGYNQSALLARRAGEPLGIPCLELLRRVRPTAQQVGLGANERRLNVAGAFGVVNGPDPSGMRLILVDDVVTTGSTLGACADTLVAAGAVDVRAATLAREL